jgi:hypothetical protein
MPWNVPPVSADQNPTKAAVDEAGMLIEYGVPVRDTAAPAGLPHVTATRAYDPPDSSLAPELE